MLTVPAFDGLSIQTLVGYRCVVLMLLLICVILSNIYLGSNLSKKGEIKDGVKPVAV